VQDYALQIKGFPWKDIKEIELKNYLEDNFGKVKEVIFARVFKGMLAKFAK